MNDHELEGFVTAWKWARQEIVQEDVVRLYQAAGGSKEWWRGWMSGLKVHYFRPFEHERSNDA